MYYIYILHLFYMYHLYIRCIYIYIYFVVWINRYIIYNIIFAYWSLHDITLGSQIPGLQPSGVQSCQSRHSCLQRLPLVTSIRVRRLPTARRGLISWTRLHLWYIGAYVDIYIYNNISFERGPQGERGPGLEASKINFDRVFAFVWKTWSKLILGASRA